MFNRLRGRPGPLPGKVGLSSLRYPSASQAMHESCCGTCNSDISGDYTSAYCRRLSGGMNHHKASCAGVSKVVGPPRHALRRCKHYGFAVGDEPA